MRSAFRLALVLFVLLCMTRGGLAQSTNSGDVRGTVMDSSGAAVAGATVTLTNIATRELQSYV